MTSAPDDDDVRTLLAEACQVMLGLDVQPLRAAAPAPDGEYLRGRVVVTGAWQGAVSLACTAAFAQQAANCIFDEGRQASPEDVRDALGELTNIVGGGVKGLMPSPSHLSLPIVTKATGWRDDESLKSALAREVWFSCSGENFVVTIVPRT